MKIKRRDFLTRTLQWIGFGAWMFWLRPALSGAAKGAEWYKIGKLEDFEIEKPKLIQTGRRIENDLQVHLGALYVIRSESGLRAMSAICTHAGCEVQLAEQGGFVCPCHSSKFDAQGAVLKGPARSALVTLPVQVENGEVFVLITE